MACVRWPLRRWLAVLGALASLPAHPGAAQRPSELSALELTYELQSSWAEGVAESRRAAALQLLIIAEAVAAPRDAAVPSRPELLPEAVRLADRVATLDRELDTALGVADRTRGSLIGALEGWAASLREAVQAADGSAGESAGEDPEASLEEVEAELQRLRATAADPRRTDPLAGAPALTALAAVATTEYRRAVTSNAMREELRLFMGGLRLFDETGMPPSARTGGGGDPDPGCPPVACPITGSAPRDVPLAHFRPGELADRSGMALTPAELDRLRRQLGAHVAIPCDPVVAPAAATRDGAADGGAVVTRQGVLDVGATGFRTDQGGISGPGVKAAVSTVHAFSLGVGLQLTVEPAAGARGFRLHGNGFGAAVAEVRETLSGAGFAGRVPWQLLAWQKGRVLPEPLPSPGYLEPGRLEAGVTGRLSVPVHTRWAIDAAAGGEAVRYAPADWQTLDRQGLEAALGLTWRQATRSGTISLRGARHVFPVPPPGSQSLREDSRIGVSLEGTLERIFIASVSGGLSLNRSTLPAYDFQSARAALAVSTPLGGGSVQAYGALAAQRYLNPGPEERRVAPSDQDSGSMVSIRYLHPLDAHRTLVLRGDWSRSVTGFHDEFYHRVGTSVQLTFRGR